MKIFLQMNFVVRKMELFSSCECRSKYDFSESDATVRLVDLENDAITLGHWQSILSMNRGKSIDNRSGKNLSKSKRADSNPTARAANFGAPGEVRYGSLELNTEIVPK
jgi:hypothetical protein